MSEPGAGSEVIVVGGGLAGLSAALDLAEGAVRTLLIEKRPFPGGKTFSFPDKATGVELDNGQHIYLRCCSAYLGLIDRLGLREQIRTQPRLRIPVLDPVSGERSEIGAAWWLPAPLHLAPSLARYRHLTLGEKLRLVRAAWPMLHMRDAERRRLDDRSFGAWLRAHGQSDAAIERFWDLVVLPTCNDHSDAVSASQAIMVFQTGLLRDTHSGDLGYATVGLSAIADRALARFRAAGGVARPSAGVESIEHDGARATGVRLARGESIAADGVVLALPPNRITPLLPPAWRAAPGLAALEEIRYAPIVNVHLRWDRRVLGATFIAVLDPAVQYLFNRSRILGLDGTEQWLTCSLSGAHTQSRLPRATVAEAAIAGVRRALPAARPATVLTWRVVKEQEATFRPEPGIAARRLSAETPIPNLLLAGAWTDTEWPATMESAVRSGQRAAAVWLARRRGTGG